MKEEFKSDHWKDFSQRYQGTYGWYEREDKGKLLVYLAKVDEDNLTFQDESGFKYYARPDKDNYFTFIPVERGCYNFETNEVVVVRRHPARQWKRGLCSENTIIQRLSDNQNLGVGFKVLDSIFTPKPNTALERFKAHRDCNVAFDRTLAHVNGKLYIYNNVIGEYKTGGFHLSNALFKQEVEDVVKRNNLNIMVYA